MQFIDPTAVIHDGAQIGRNAVIGARVIVGARSVIGSGCAVHDDTIIGESVRVFDNAVLGRPPQRVASLTRAPSANLAPLTIGDGCVVGACAVLYRGTSIGAATLIGDLATIREQCRIGHDTIVARLVSVNYEAVIGNCVKIMDNSHITGNMVIEDGVFISVLVSTSNDNDMDRRKGAKAHEMHGPIIRRGASIGASATLLPGVVIGEYAMVAAGAHVCRPVPARKVVAGSPARIVRDVPADMIPDVS